MLPEMMLDSSVKVSPADDVAMPPPLPAAVLPTIVLFCTTSWLVGPRKPMPPPLPPAELPEIVVFLTNHWFTTGELFPQKYRPAPTEAPVQTFPETVELLIVKNPSSPTYEPPPWLPAVLPEIVLLLIVTVATG